MIRRRVERPCVVSYRLQLDADVCVKGGAMGAGGPV